MKFDELKVGMKVRVHKPLDVYQYPEWTPSMDIHDGTVITVERLEVDSVNGDTFTHKGWHFNPEWAEPVEADNVSVKPVTVTNKSHDQCPCSVRDLLWVGHRCGRKAPIDTRR